MVGTAYLTVHKTILVSVSDRPTGRYNPIYIAPVIVRGSLQHHRPPDSRDSVPSLDDMISGAGTGLSLHSPFVGQRQASLQPATVNGILLTAQGVSPWLVACRITPQVQ